MNIKNVLTIARAIKKVRISLLVALTVNNSNNNTENSEKIPILNINVNRMNIRDKLIKIMLSTVQSIFYPLPLINSIRYKIINKEIMAVVMMIIIAGTPLGIP